MLSCDIVVVLGELVWLVFVTKLATVSREESEVAVAALFPPVSL